MINFYNDEDGRIVHFDYPRSRMNSVGKSNIVWSLIVDFILLAVLYIGSGLTVVFRFKQDYTFYPFDTSLMNPIEKETITSGMMGVICWGIPLFIILFSSYFLFYKNKWDAIYAFKGCLESLLLALFTTSIFWLFIIDLRPTFLTLCEPQGGKLYSLSFDNICQNNMSFIELQGFPSGHASLASAGWIFVLLYLNSHLRPFDNTGHLWKLCVTILIPVSMILFVGITRIMNNRHFPHQVIGGWIIGIFSAFFAYRLNFAGLYKMGHIPVKEMLDRSTTVG